MGVSSYLPTEFEWIEYIPKDEYSIKKEKAKQDKIKKKQDKLRKKEEQLKKDIEILNMFTEHYKKKTYYIKLAREILRKIDAGNFEYSYVDGYVKVKLHEDYSLISEMKEICFPDKFKTKFKNAIPYVIDISGGLDSENHNTQIVLCYHKVKQELFRSEKWEKDILEMCINKAKKTFKENEDAYNKYISSLKIKIQQNGGDKSEKTIRNCINKCDVGGVYASSCL